MKKLIALVLTLMFTLTAVAALAEAPATTDTPSKTLVVYYSATGSTERIANMIAAETGADVFVITPVEPYTDEDLNWTNDNSRVVYEHDHPEAQNEVAQTEITPENWDNYDTVYIGYPIWWGIAAWPVNQFVTGNDFTGKAVIPFCTSASSGLGQSGALLAEAAGTGEWLEGARFSYTTEETDVQAWVAADDVGNSCAAVWPAVFLPKENVAAQRRKVFLDSRHNISFQHFTSPPQFWPSPPPAVRSDPPPSHAAPA